MDELKRSHQEFFQRHAGREIAVTEETRKVNTPWGEVVFNNAAFANGADPVVEDIKRDAKMRGYSLRFAWPEGMDGYSPKSEGQICVPVEKKSDGKWCVGRNIRVN